MTVNLLLDILSILTFNDILSSLLTFVSLEKARMVGERDREQDAVRWELEDTAAISIPPPFNNGILQYNQLQQQHYAAMAAAAATTAEDMPDGHWEDEQNYDLMGENMAGGVGGGAAEKGVRFPVLSPTHGFSTGQLSQAPLQRTHSRYF